MNKPKKKPIERLTAHLAELPGVGDRTAQRFAYHIARMSRTDALSLSEAIRDVHEYIKQCSVCCLLSESDPCHICAASNRDRTRICVVEASRDANAIESSGSFKGLYHVLGGRLAPLDGVEPEHLSITQLVKRVKNGSVEEIILATNPDMEGDTTAAMIKDVIEDIENVRVTRLARGLPSGSHLEYANAAVLSQALEERRSIG